MNAPDPKEHQLYSFVKSSMRVVGFGLLPFRPLSGALILIVAEGVGVLEELV